MSSIDTSKIIQHMDVIAADGQNIGKVDHMQDGRIKLAKTSSPDGQHHFVPLDWIDHIDQHVHLNKTLSDIRAQASGGAKSDAVPAAKPHDAV
jgi:hypothetical protein